MKGEIRRNPWEERKEERCLRFHESQGIEIVLPEDACDPMSTTQEGGGELNQKNDSGEESSLVDLEPGSAETISSRYVSGRKRTLVEIFSILPLEKENTPGVHQILQEDLVLIAGTDHDGSHEDHVLCHISDDSPMQIDSQGYLILTGLHCGIEIQDYIGMGPSHDVNWDVPSNTLLWDSFVGDFDSFMCRWLETINGFMVVKFAVYRDGLEAQLELTMSDLELPGMPIEVYGTVTASNSVVPHSEAKTYLFNHFRSDYCAMLDLAPSAKAEIPLPLSRRVTAIPRDSTLIVDLNLLLRCASGDILVANESVSFHAGTRSKTVEEHIIEGSCAKLKVRVTWIEALECDGVGKVWKKEVVDGDGVAEDEEEVMEDEDGISEECDRVGDQGTESDYISDDDRSLRSCKMRRLDCHDEVSTSTVDDHTTEAMEIAGWEQGASQNLMPSDVERFKERYLEVFSVKFLDFENLKSDEIYGLIMIHTGFCPVLLFRRVRGDPSKIDSQGFAVLEGPRHYAWNVCNDVFIVPFLFKYQEFEFTGKHGSCELWRESDYDKLLCNILDNDLGRIEVKFAVCDDAVVARLSIMLIDCSFSWAQVHGTITASNSMLENPAAVSFVFKKEKSEAVHVTVGPGKEISLPLLRHVVALPLGSIFTVNVNISSEGESIIHHPFKVTVPLSDEIEQTFPGNGCGVRVHMEFLNERDNEGFYFH